jgi:hypothetical protein
MTESEAIRRILIGGGLAGCVGVTLSLLGYPKDRGPPPREVVLRPGESVTASNGSGAFKITYVSPFRRRFEFDGHRETVKLRVRPERFAGKLGLYDPADAWVFAPPAFRLLLEEAERHFDSYEALYRALRSEVSMNWVYTHDGLVTGYHKLSAPGHFDVYWISLFQFYVAGKKPAGLIGADDSAVRLEHGVPR